MDKTFQDIHICHRQNNEEMVYRQIRIEKIVFKEEMIYVSYKDHNGIEMTMGIPKVRYMAITID